MSLIVDPNQPVSEEQEEIAPDEYVRLVGNAGIDVLEPTMLIRAGITEANRIEFYISDSSGDWFVKYCPHHDFEETAWRNRRKAQPEQDEPVPFRTTFTNNGLMIRMKNLPEDDMKKVLFDHTLKDFSIFPERKDEWDW